MKFNITPLNLQELGKRTNQEDSLFPGVGLATSADRLFILCDGMGGHENGEVASSTVCEVMSRTILHVWNPSQPLSDEIFEQALNAAYDALDAKDTGGERKMGTTMTLVCLHAGGATVAHIGDSRVYQVRPAKNGIPAHIVFRTQDHSLVNDLVKIGEITPEEALHHPQKNVITRAMQPHQERRAKADIAHLTDVQPGDYFYMCSDGMLEETTDENIVNIITMPGKTNEEKVEILRKCSSENKDNHTAHLIYVAGVEGAIAVTRPPVAPMNNGQVGVFVHPNQPAPKPKKGHGWVIGICALLCAVAMLGIGGWFYLNNGKNKKIPMKTIKVNVVDSAAGHNRGRTNNNVPEKFEKPNNSQRTIIVVKEKQAPAPQHEKEDEQKGRQQQAKKQTTPPRVNPDKQTQQPAKDSNEKKEDKENGKASQKEEVAGAKPA